MLRMMIIRPVQIIGEKINRMAEGDLTQQIDLHSGDEIGRMAQAFNTMSVRLREMFGMVYDLASSVGATSQQLTAGAEQTSRASETIAQSMQEVSEGAMAQSRMAEETSRIVEDTSGGIRRVAESSGTAAAAAEEMSRQTKLGNERMHEAVEKIGTVHRSVQDVAAAFRQLTIAMAGACGISR